MITSRGEEEEYLVAIENLLHTEVHLTDAMAKNPSQARAISKKLDDTRLTRQNLVKEWIGDAKINHAFWCPLKHSILTTGHIREIISNSSRSHPGLVPKLSQILNKEIKRRNTLAYNFLGYDENNPTKGCPRCAADLNIHAKKKCLILQDEKGNTYLMDLQNTKKNVRLIVNDYRDVSNM